MTQRVFSIGLMGLLAIGCGGRDGESDSRPGGSGDEDPFDSDDGPGSASTSSASGSGSGDDVPRFDMGAETDMPTVDKTCQLIDFVFVVDNSRSMADEQANLASAVPGFIEAMKTALPSVENFRVGVIDTDSYPGIGTLETPLDGCPNGEDCDVCEYQLGAFLSRPDSAIDLGESCDFSTDVNYMDGDSPTFDEEFECAAIVGTDGNPVEQQIGALVQAISPELAGADGCNEGFVRDKALLVFLVISDEEDDHEVAPGPPYGGSIGSPERWYDAVLSAKDGKATNVVALSLTGGSPKYDDCSNLADNMGAEEAPRIQTFIELFDTKFSGSVCSEGYDRFFNEALEAVQEGCLNFIP